MHTTHPWPSTKIKNRDFKAIFFKIPFLKLPNLTLSFHWFLNTLNFTPSLSLRVTPVISHGSGQPLFTTPVAQVVQSKQEEAWKRTRVGGSAPLTDFPPVDPFADAPSRGPITVIHSRRHDTDSIAYHRYVPAETAELCRNTESHFFPHPFHRITLSSFGRGKERGTRGRRDGFAGQARDWKRERVGEMRETIHARDRACVRRKNEEDGRRTARPLVQGRRRSQLRAEAACRCVPLSRYKRAIWKRGATPISFGRRCRPCQTPRPPSDSKGGDRDRDRNVKAVEATSVVDRLPIVLLRDGSKVDLS